jgi:hypothetical protein
MNGRKQTTKEARPLAHRRLADLAEVAADGTSVGKSVTANRLCHLYREAGRAVTLVRIETGRRRTAETGAADREIYIATEEFTGSSGKTGGLSGVLEPLWNELVDAPNTGSAVVVDWAGGSGGIRLDVMAATAFDETLKALGVRGMSLVLTTCAAESMTQAGAYLSGLATVAPTLRRALVLSGRAGSFDVPTGSEQAESLARLKATAGTIPTIAIPHVPGRALETCADAGLDVASAMMMEADVLGHRLGIDIFRARALASELAVWWRRSGSALTEALEEPDADPAA